MDITVWEEIFRIALSGILSGIIGFEREKHGREAGLRTMLLVGMGVTTILISSFNVYNVFSNINSPILKIDPARIAYGVVTGIGFLGAGAIIKDKKRVRGLTTAACLWIVTSIGLAVGCGLYTISIFTTIFAVFVLYILKKIEYKILPDLYNTLTVIVNEETKNMIEELKNFIKNFGIKVLSISFEKDIENKTSSYTFTLRYNQEKSAIDLTEKITQIENIKKLIWK